MCPPLATFGSLNHVIPASVPASTVEYRSELVDAYVALFNALERLRADPANWSGMTVAPPDAAQAEAAHGGLIMLLLERIPAPELMLLDDGTVAVFWRRGEAYASIDFDADGEFSWTAANASDVQSGTWSGGELPAQLRDIIGT